MGFDPIAMQQAANKAKKALEASGQVGSETTEIGAMTFDWSYYYSKMLAEEYITVNDTPFVKILDRPIEKSEIQSVTVASFGTLTSADLLVEDVDMGGWAALVTNDDGAFPIVLVAPVDLEGDGALLLPKGTYSVLIPDGDQTTGEGCNYVSEIYGVLTKTIKPIDPKYLPGVITPKIELSEATAMSLMGGGSAMLDAVESAAFEDAASEAAPVALFVSMQGVTVTSAILTYGFIPDVGLAQYVGVVPGWNEANGAIAEVSIRLLVIDKTADGWRARYGGA